MCKKWIRKNRLYLEFFGLLGLVFVIGTIFGALVFSTTRVEIYEYESTHEPLVVKGNPTSTTCVPTTTTTIASTTMKTAVADKWSQVALDDETIEFTISMASKYNVPVELVFSVMYVESRFDNKAVSSTGDYGIMQINEKYHAYFCDKVGVPECISLYNNIEVGCYILGNFYEKYGNVNMVCMAYNMGEGGASSYFADGIYHTSYSDRVSEFMRGL